MLSRRSFLGGLLGSVTAALVVRDLPAFARDTVDVPEPFSAPGWGPTYQAALWQIHKEFIAERARLGWPVTPAQIFTDRDYSLGHVLPNGQMVAHQLNVACRAGDDVVIPVAFALAAGSVRRGIDSFGRLPLPPSVAQAWTAGALRLIAQYDGHDEQLVRIDLCGGLTKPAFYRMKKDAIRERLRRPRRTLPLPD